MKWSKKFERVFLNSLFKRREQYMFITSINKTQARILLSINDPGNREISSKSVEYYTELMNTGKWEIRKGSFIGLGYYDEIVTNGQHRLTAFINSNLEELKTYFCFG